MNYSRLVREHFTRAASAGVLGGAGVGRGAAGSAAQGTWVQFDLRLAAVLEPVDAPLRIAEARFLAFGCPHTIAVADWLAGMAPGREASLALPEPAQALLQRFEAPVEKLGRLFVVEDAWIGAVRAALAVVRQA